MTISVAVALGVLLLLGIAGFLFVWFTAVPPEPEKPPAKETIRETIVEKTFYFPYFQGASRSGPPSPPGGEVKWQ